MRADYAILILTVALVAGGSLSLLGRAQGDAIAAIPDGAGAPASLVVSSQAGLASTGRAAFATSRAAVVRAGAATRVLWRRALAAPRRWFRPGAMDATLDRAVAFHIHDPETGLRLHINLPRTATPPAGHAPVLVTPGVAAFGRNFHSIPQALLDRGFAVAVLDIPSPWTLRLAKRVAYAERAMDILSGFDGFIDMSRASAVGHSLGGSTAVALSATDARIARTVAFSPGFLPSPRGMWGSLQRGEIPRGNRMADLASSTAHSPRLIVGATLDHLVPPRAYAKPMADACMKPGHCTYAEISHAGHGNFSDMHLPQPRLWWPTRGNLSATRKVDLTALSPRARTGASQRRVAGELAADYLAPLLIATTP